MPLDQHSPSHLFIQNTEVQHYLLFLSLPDKYSTSHCSLLPIFFFSSLYLNTKLIFFPSLNLLWVFNLSQDQLGLEFPGGWYVR